MADDPPGDASRGDSPAPDDAQREGDVVLLTGPTEDGEGIRVVRARGDQLDAGEVRPLKEGKPLVAGEIVKLAPRPGRPRVCDVHVLAKVEEVAPRAAPGRGKGPPKVSSEAYRESWERIFGPGDRGALN
jgi:hypothetical protein